MAIKLGIISATSSYGGISSYCINLCTGLMQKDMDVTLFIPVEERYSNKWIYHEAVKNNIKTLEFPVTSKNPLKLGKKLFSLVRENGINIIHTNCYRFNIITRIARVIAYFHNHSFKHILTVHGNNPIKVIPWQILTYQFIDGFFSFMNTRTITVSDFTRKIFLKRAIVCSSKVVTIHNSIPCKAIETDLEEEVPINKDNSINIIFIGRLSIEKGIDFLIKIIVQFINKSRYSDRVTFHIYGDGEYSGKIQELTHQFPSNIIYEGVTSNSGLVLRNAYLLMVTSLSEALPLVILESMSHGVPVISSGVGGVPEIIEDNINGLLVEYGDVNRFVNAIEMLLDNKSFKDELVKNAYDTLYSKFGFDRFIGSYLSLLSEL